MYSFIYKLVNALTANELSLALSNIEDQAVKELITRVQGLIFDRMECFALLKKLEQKEHNLMLIS